MASVGSVELSLTLDRSEFDKELRSLSTLELKPISLDVKFDSRLLQRQLKEIASGDYDCVPIDLCPDIKGFERKLKDLPKSLVDCILVDICPDLDTDAIKAQFKAIENDFKLSVETAINASVKVTNASAPPDTPACSRQEVLREPAEKQTEGMRRGAQAASQEIEDGFRRASEKINEAIDQSLKNAAGVITAPFKGVFTGFFEGIGQNLSRALSNSAIQSFQRQVGVSLKDTGTGVGNFVGKKTNVALGRQGEGGGTGGVGVTPPVRPKTPTGSQGALDFEKELKALSKELGTLAKFVSVASGGSDKFGASAIRTAQKVLDLGSEISTLTNILARFKTNTSSSQTTRSNTPPNSSTSSKNTPIVQDATTTPKRGFLKGDLKTLQPEDARKQVEAVRSRLEKQLAALQQLPESEKTNARIITLLRAITTVEQRIIADIANPDIPKAVRQSLGQLKAVSSKLETTKRAVEAEVARASASRKLPGIAKAGVGAAVGSGLLGAGGAFASGGAGSAGLGLAGLPFDPTLGIAAGAIAASLVAARKVPALLRKVGANKAADVLETDVSKLAVDSVKSVFVSLRGGLNNSIKKVSGTIGQSLEQGVSGLFGGVKNALKGLFGKSEQVAKTAIESTATSIKNYGFFGGKDSSQNKPSQFAGFIRLSRAQASPINTPPPPKSPPRTTASSSTPPPRPQKDISLAPPVPEKYWERFFRGIEARFYRSQLFSGIAPKDRRSLTSEATGFFASGAALTAPIASTGFLATPLLAALTPLITTVGLVANAVGPLVGTIAETLKQIEPLQKRLEFTSGGKAQASQDTQFIQGLAGQFNIPELASIDQFSKFQAAAKGSKLEGEQLREIFEGIVLGSKALSLSTQDLNLVMFAFTQILGKNKLSAEEIRQQIAERFPPAVGVFSRALGVTTQEFNRLLESGSLLAEDVLPKVGKQLKLEFGDAALEGSKTFDSALTRIDNAINRVKVGIANSLAPVLTAVTNSIGGGLELVGQNADKLVGILGVVLAGVSAQFFVGLTQILEGSGILAKMQGFLVPLFSRLFVTLTPFAIGILADFLDDVLGAQTSVIQNLMQGSYNLVLSVILVIKDLSTAVGDLLAGLPKNDALSGFGNIFGGIFNGLKNITKIIPSTVVELTSLTLILIQTTVLARQGLNLVLARLGTTLAELGASFIASARSGGIFKSVLNTLTAGLKLTEVAAFAATAAFVLFFAKADFSNELGSKFDELGNKITSNLKRIQDGLKETATDLKNLPSSVPDFKSKGFDLTFGLGEATGLGTIRTDDIIKGDIEFYKRLREEGRISEEEFQRQNQRNPNFNATTIAEKQFNENLLKLQSQSEEAQKVIDSSGLLNGSFASNAAGRSLAQIRGIDEQIRALQNNRSDLLSGDNADSESVKREVSEIDAEVQKLLKNRDQLKEPIQAVKDSILGTATALNDALKAIESSDLPENAKQQARDALSGTIGLTEKAKGKLEELNAVDLSPLGNQFADVTKKITESDRALEKTLNKNQLSTIAASTAISEQLSRGEITPDQAAQRNAQVELNSLKEREKTLSDFVDTRRDQLRDLLAVPSPNPEQLETIEKTQKEIEGKELELAQSRLQISQKVVEGKRQTEEQILRDFQKVNAKAQIVMAQAENKRTKRIKERQLSGALTDEDADIELSQSAIANSKAEVAEANRQLVEFNKIRGSLQLSAEDAAVRELELTKAVGDATLRAIDAEIAARDALRQKRIRDVEELVSIEQAAIDRTKNVRLNAIKEQQLQGRLTPDQAAAQTTTAEIASTRDSIALAKTRLTATKQLRAEGVLSAREAAAKEREIIASIAQYEGQIFDLRLTQQQQARERSLALLENANRKAIALIDKQQLQADIAVKRGALNLPLNEDSDRTTQKQLEQNQAESTRRRITQAQTELKQLSRANFETDAEYTNKRIELESNFGNLIKQNLDERLSLQKRNQEDAITAINRRVEGEKVRGDLVIQNLEDEKTALDLFNASLERSKQLLESRSSVSKAISDAAISQGEGEIALLDQALQIRQKLSDENLTDVQKSAYSGLLSQLGGGGSELDILSRRQQLEDSVAARKQAALLAEQKLARDLLNIDLQRQRATAQTAIFEAQIARDRALIARLEAVGQLNEAEVKQDDRLVNLAKQRLELQDKIVASTDKQLDSAKANLDIQDELAKNSIAALDAQQKGALESAASAEKLRNVSQDLLKIDTQYKGREEKKTSDPITQSPTPNTETQALSRPSYKFKSLLAKAQYDLLGIVPGESAYQAVRRQLFGVGKKKKNEELQALADIPFASAIPDIKVSRGLKPDQSGSIGLNRATSVEAQLNAMLGLKPLGEELQKSTEAAVKPETNGFTAFTDGLKQANTGIEQRLDTLNKTMNNALNSPRSLYISTPEPVTDAAKIMSDVTRQSIVGAGLG